jgi:F420-dependent oxidoreductase-like protein
MDLRIFTEPQLGASYDDLLAVAKESERLGFDAFFRSDHYLTMGSASGLPGPTDSWVTLGALARETSRIRLGTLVTSATFRFPGPLAISVAQADQMSGGRIELGIGAGWYEAEHVAYAIPFPPLKERFDRLEEQLTIITGLWDAPEGANYHHDGRYYQVADSPGLPKPAQRPRPPIIIGGGGAKRTPELAARFADEFNRAFAPLENFTLQRDRVIAACEAIDRDPASMRFSAALTLAVGKAGEEFQRRAAATGQRPDDLRAKGAGGTVDEVTATLRRWGDAGATRLYLQVLDLHDLDHLALVAEEIAPHLD